MENKLRDLIEQSSSILITSHIGPDGDSTSSSLLLYQTLKLNYPDKNIVVSMEEAPYGLSFLNGYDQIQFQPLAKILEDQSPDLVFILDANDWHRVTRSVADVENALAKVQPKTIVIDHHEGSGAQNLSLYINDHSPAVTLDIYELFIEKLALKKPEGYAQTALTGIYTDTGGFVHKSPKYQQVFEVVPKLLADGADLEAIVSNLNKISQKGLEMLKELFANTASTDSYIYSFISDHLATVDNHEALIQATQVFRSDFLRNIEGKSWGFIVYKDVMGAPQTYSASFRALSDTKDVSQVAGVLGGGGHKPAAGAKFQAESVEDAVRIVKEAIEKTTTS